MIAEAARKAIDQARARIRSGEDSPPLDEIVNAAKELLSEHNRTLLQPVINATGVLIHTNLGRVPLGPQQLEAVTKIASGYSTLELDLDTGRRGSRYTHAGRLLAQATGAEAGLVVNNNAAAVLLLLAGLCAGKEVIISRGELVEIGGEFRIPEVMSISGAELVEVGTTNRTHLADYEKAITDRTAAILKVHPSNYRVVGFTASVTAAELGRLARGRKVYLLHDLGSGLLRSDTDGGWMENEPRVGDALRDGADVVTFSGDKLLGGPQAGLIVGRAQLIKKLAEHALVRALRVDKMTLAALQATLTLYLEGRSDNVPLWSMVNSPLDRLEKRATAIATSVGASNEATGIKAAAVRTKAVAGGGSTPGAEFDSWGVGLSRSGMSASAIEGALRAGRPPVIARIEKDQTLLDLRTVPEAIDETLVKLVLVAHNSSRI